MSFENLTRAESLLHTLEVTSCVRDIKRGVNIFKGASIYIQGVTGGTDQTSGECSLC